MDGVIGTGLLAGAVAQAAIGTGQVAGANLGGGQAVLDALVFKLPLGIVAAAAVHMGHFPVLCPGFHTHDGGDFGSRFRSAHSAAAAGSFPRHHGAGKAGAAGIAAAAAVGPGQHFGDLGQALVLLHMENLRAHRQQQAEKQAHGPQGHHWGDDRQCIQSDSPHLLHRGLCFR